MGVSLGGNGVSVGRGVLVGSAVGVRVMICASSGVLVGVGALVTTVIGVSLAVGWGEGNGVAVAFSAGRCGR